jgi:secreted trypsin-like serine protease
LTSNYSTLKEIHMRLRSIVIAAAMGLSAFGCSGAEDQAESSVVDDSIASEKSAIIGGTDAIAHQFPYMLSLQSYGSHICGAVILNSQWAITTAHCASGPLGGLQVVAGLQATELEARIDLGSWRYL